MDESLLYFSLILLPAIVIVALVVRKYHRSTCGWRASGRPLYRSSQDAGTTNLYNGLYLSQDPGSHDSGGHHFDGDGHHGGMDTGGHTGGFDGGGFGGGGGDGSGCG
ncbi:MAG TPA: hypothetical protein VG796_17990 [Verrucomicrobiales bacterium]|jgi:hypothetical protein|nr:hypothetical protein [Verrucomicrobiales bacterium]